VGADMVTAGGETDEAGMDTEAVEARVDPRRDSGVAIEEDDDVPDRGEGTELLESDIVEIGGVRGEDEGAAGREVKLELEIVKGVPIYEEGEVGDQEDDSN